MIESYPQLESFWIFYIRGKENGRARVILYQRKVVAWNIEGSRYQYLKLNFCMNAKKEIEPYLYKCKMYRILDRDPSIKPSTGAMQPLWYEQRWKWFRRHNGTERWWKHQQCLKTTHPCTSHIHDKKKGRLMRWNSVLRRETKSYRADEGNAKQQQGIFKQSHWKIRQFWIVLIISHNSCL